MKRISMVILASVALSGAASAQSPPGPVGPSVSSSTHPTGKTPPGTPTAATPDGRIARDAVGQKVIGHTATPAGGPPGNTGGGATGKK